jgi:hypothetical protein
MAITHEGLIALHGIQSNALCNAIGVGQDLSKHLLSTAGWFRPHHKGAVSVVSAFVGYSVGGIRAV